MESVFLALDTGDGNSTNPRLPATNPITLQTGLAGLIDDYVAGWRSVAATLSMAAVGGGAVALLTLGLVCLLAGRRRASSLRLWMSRGVSRGQFRAGLLAETLVVVVPAAALGTLLALAVIPSGPVEPTLVASAAVLIFAAGLIFRDGAASSRDFVGLSASSNLSTVRARGSEGGRGIAALTRGASPAGSWLKPPWWCVPSAVPISCGNAGLARAAAMRAWVGRIR